MAKDKAETAQESGAAPALVPSQFELVGIDPGVKEVYVTQLNRSYTIEELTQPDIALALSTLGWPHIKKA